jgi:hypothetical protein
MSFIKAGFVLGTLLFSGQPVVGTEPPCSQVSTLNGFEPSACIQSSFPTAESPPLHSALFQELFEVEKSLSWMQKIQQVFGRHFSSKPSLSQAKELIKDNYNDMRYSHKRDDLFKYYITKQGSIVFEIRGIDDLIFKIKHWPNTEDPGQIVSNYQSLEKLRKSGKLKTDHLIIPRLTMFKAGDIFVVAIEKIDLESNAVKQREAFDRIFKSFDKDPLAEARYRQAFTELVDVICYTGLWDVNVRNVPLTRNGDLALIDLDYNTNDFSLFWGQYYASLYGIRELLSDLAPPQFFEMIYARVRHNFNMWFSENSYFDSIGIGFRQLNFVLQSASVTPSAKSASTSFLQLKQDRNRLLYRTERLADFYQKHGILTGTEPIRINGSLNGLLNEDEKIVLSRLVEFLNDELNDKGELRSDIQEHRRIEFDRYVLYDRLPDEWSLQKKEAAFYAVLHKINTEAVPVNVFDSLWFDNARVGQVHCRNPMTIFDNCITIQI